MATLRIGTRGSDLALWQARHIAQLLEAIGLPSEIVIIKTKGDQIQHLSFDKMEGKGFFTKEIEDALLNHEIDLAVHSHKDLETSQPKGLCIVAVPQRGFVEDLLIIRKEAQDSNSPFGIKNGAVIGTSSARRKSQLQFHLTDCNIKDLRGNVPTRVEKLRDGHYDAIVLARAGVERLNLDLSDLHVTTLDPTEFVPAPAQGALAIQMREDDDAVKLLEALNVDADAQKVRAERTLLRLLDGGCQMPFGAYCVTTEQGFGLYVSIAENAAEASSYAYLEGDNPEELATRMFEMLKKKD